MVASSMPRPRSRQHGLHFCCSNHGKNAGKEKTKWRIQTGHGDFGCWDEAVAADAKKHQGSVWGLDFEVSGTNKQFRDVVQTRSI